MPSDFLKRLVESVKRLTGGASTSALPVLLCPSPARYHVRRWLEPFLPKVTVLAPGEIPPEIRVRSIGTVVEAGLVRRQEEVGADEEWRKYEHRKFDSGTGFAEVVEGEALRRGTGVVG